MAPDLMDSVGGGNDEWASRLVGRFRLEQEIGRGGMGVVYRATDPDGCPAAVKLLLGVEPSGAEEMLRRFEREARVRVDHRNVCRVLDAGCASGGIPYIVFDLLQGEDLDKRLRRGVLSAPDAVGIGVQVCDGLAAAHGAGVIHRDLKPSNLFICTDGTVKLFDFGIALFSHGDETRMTVAGSVLGTPWYLSPEQAQGKVDIDARTDVWSLGAVLYEALAGEPPFARETALASMVAALMEEPAPLLSRAPGTPAALARVVEVALHKPVEERWPTAEAFGQALRAADATVSGRVEPRREAAVTIRPGEQRVVVVLLAEGVRDVAEIGRAVGEFGGRFLTLLGGRAIGVFGGEAWEGDEAVRAASAALRARTAAARLAVGSGRAAQQGAGISGAALAAAEAGCALGLDGVAVDAALAPALAERFALRAAYGKFQELVAVRRASQPAPREDQSGTVGRDPELALLTRAVDAALGEGRAALVLVTGPPGIGKTRLRQELGRIVDLSGGRSLVGRGEPLRKDTAFSLLASALLARAGFGALALGWPHLDPETSDDARREAIRRLAGEAVAAEDAAPPPWADALGELLGVEPASTPRARPARSDPQLVADRFRAALYEYFVGLGRRQPFALLLEDVQWGDAASLDLVDGLLDALGDSPFVVFVTARPEAQEGGRELFPGRDAIRIALRGLGLADVRLLASQVAGRPLPEPLVRAVAERTAGTPLFVREIVLELRDRGMLDRGVEDLPLPLTVEAAVQSRLDHLPPAEKELCKRAAVLGRPFLAEEVAALGVAGPDAAIDTLCRKDVLGARARTAGAGPREYRFRSTLVGDVAYRMIAEDVRAHLHRQAAAFVGTNARADPEEVAVHHERGAQPAEAGRWYATATLAAERRGDSHSVVRCAERALAVGAPADTIFPVRAAYAEALGYLGHYDRQVLELVRALDAAPGEAQRGRVLLEQADALYRTGRSAEALAAAEGAAEAARMAGDVDQLAQVLAWQAPVLARSGRTTEAGEALIEAQSLRQDLPPGMLAFIASSRATTAALAGDVAKRLEAGREAIDLYRRAGDIRRAAGAESALADTMNRFGAYAQAVSLFERALGDCRRVGNRRAEALALANLAYSLTMLGRPQEALEKLAQSDALARATRAARIGAVVRVYRARALLETGAPETALAEAEKAVAEGETLQWTDGVVLALAAGARAQIALGAPVAALAMSGRALDMRDRLGGIEEDEAEVFLVRAEALLACGRGSEARDVLVRGRARLEDLAARIGDPAWRSRFLRDVKAHRGLLETV